MASEYEFETVCNDAAGCPPATGIYLVAESESGLTQDFILFPSMTLEDLRSHIQFAFSLEMRSIELSHRDLGILRDETLEYLCSGEYIRVVSCPLEPCVRVMVHLLSGRFQSFDIYPGMYARDLTEQLALAFYLRN